jgi:hypothetical protein
MFVPSNFAWKLKGEIQMATIFIPSATNILFSNATVKTLDDLRNKRITWEATYYKKSNEGLYGLLAEAKEVFDTKFMKATEGDRKTLRKDLEEKLKADGLRAQRNTTTLTMFVRFVFGNDRKRAHAYTYVIKAAISHDVPAANLAGYIAEQGGIEEIKRKMVVSEVALVKQAELAKAQTEVIANLEEAAVKPLATIKLANISGDYVILLAKPTVDGDVNVIGVLADVNEALYNALLKKLAKQKMTVDAENAALAKETNDLLDVPANDADMLNKLAA